MTTIITIVVVALVFFVTICVVAFMIWKRETEMRTDSIKAIEYNVEEMLYELTGSSSREIRRNRVKRGENADREQGGVQQEITEKQNDTDRKSESDIKAVQDPFGWMRTESGAEPGRREETADAEVKARENITVFEPAAVPHESYERRRSGSRSQKTSRYGLRWTEVAEEKKQDLPEDDPGTIIRSDEDIVPEPFVMPEPEPAFADAAIPEPEPEQIEHTDAIQFGGIQYVPQMPHVPQMPQASQETQWLQGELQVQPPQVLQEIQWPQEDAQQQVHPQQQQTREGGMISKLLKRRRKQKAAEEQEQQIVQQTETVKQDPLYGWVENYEARNMRQTRNTPPANEVPQEEQIYEPYEPHGKMKYGDHQLRRFHEDGEAVGGAGYADAGQADPKDEWKEKTVEDLLREYIDEPFGAEKADAESSTGTGYNVGRSGRKYTIEELETLIKE